MEKIADINGEILGRSALSYERAFGKTMATQIIVARVFSFYNQS
jgi:hypothetical protein